MNIFYQPAIVSGIHNLDETESRHCTRVLRKKAGDQIVVTDGAGHFYHCAIVDPNPKRCTFSISKTEKESARNYRVHIAIAPTKSSDRTEWFVEKAVEIGVDAITFLECQHSERISLKMDRVHKIAIGAIKQSQRATLPKLNKPIPFEKVVSSASEIQRFIAFVDRENPDHLFTQCPMATSAIVLIGPEGDFSDEELELASRHNFHKVSLGAARLRTETAGLAACQIINLINTV